jgi:myo-inositol-1(or 4)-monophosphatase
VDTDLDVALAAARAAAGVIHRALATTTAVTMKGAVDPVTAVDEEAERAVFDLLRKERPDDALLGEESGGSDWRSPRVWIVDPLDGTVNFVHGVPQIAVSLALWQDGRPQVAVIVDVARHEEFTAEAGAGAFLNGAPVSVSERAHLGECLVATGFPYDRQAHALAYAEWMGHVLARVRGIRRIGSAALDLAWTACGRFDAYWEAGLQPWDAAAGILLVEESGGVVSGAWGRPYDLDESVLVAAGPAIHAELGELVSRHVPRHLR